MKRNVASRFRNGAPPKNNDGAAKRNGVIASGTSATGSCDRVTMPQRCTCGFIAPSALCASHQKCVARDADSVRTTQRFTPAGTVYHAPQTNAERQAAWRRRHRGTQTKAAFGSPAPRRVAAQQAGPVPLAQPVCVAWTAPCGARTRSNRSTPAASRNCPPPSGFNWSCMILNDLAINDGEHLRVIEGSEVIVGSCALCLSLTPLFILEPLIITRAGGARYVAAPRRAPSGFVLARCVGARFGR